MRPADDRRTRSTRHRTRTRTRTAAHRAATRMIEALEPRALMAAQLDAGFAEAVYVSGFDTPTAQQFAPDGRLFVLEKAGRVRVVSAAGQLQSTPFVTIGVDTDQDRGLVGIAFDPNFAANSYLYLYYTKTDSAGTRNRLSRFTANGNAAIPNSEQVIIESPMTTNIHTGGAIGFGADGYLYLGVGEGGVSSTAQDLSDLRGKMLRIDPSVDAFPNDPLRNYSIPLSNPFYGSASARGEIYAYGLRNPFTGQMRPGTSQFYVADVGQEAFEEINVIQAGGNYGWPLAEGASAATNDIDPVYQYSHAGYGSAAITGVAFNTGNQFPTTYADNVFFGDYLNGFMRRLNPSNNAVADFGTGVAGAVDIDFGPDGSLYYLSVFGNGFQGTNRPVYKISYVGAANRAPSAVAAATTPTNGLAPLTVGLTGSGSTDPDNDALTYTWNFGDGQTGNGLNVNHTYAANGSYLATLTVSDGKGGTGVSQPIAVTAGNRAPTGTITAPAAGLTYKAGDAVTFGGTATDPEDGTLAASRMTWTVKLLHNTHQHDTVAPITGTGGSFTIPATGHVEANQGYRIYLTVTDSAGLTFTTFRDVLPKTANLTLASSPAGAALTLDGQSLATAFTQSLVGATRTLGAPLSTTINGVLYTFVSWSDGGAATHDITVGSTDATYTATYQHASSAQTPYNGGAAAAIPGTIEAENFDEGGADVAYFDNTPTNLGGVAYRGGAVDLEVADDVDGGHNVGYIQAGEWLEYTVDVATTGVYSIDFRVASGNPGGTFHLEIDGVDKTGPVALNNTGGWSNWQTITKAGVALAAGRHVMRLAVDTSLGDIGRLNWIKFTQTGTTTSQTPFNGPIAVPGVIEVENFDNGGQGVAYNDLTGLNEGNSAYRTEAVDLELTGDTGGGHNLGYALPGEWLEYTIIVATGGTYSLGARVANLGAGGTFHVEVDGVNVTGTMTVPDTGAWQTFQTITKPGVNLAAGQHVLRLAFDTAGGTGFVGNINYLQLTAATPTPTPTNLAPAVNAGADQQITLPATAALSGSASDDGQPAGGVPSTAWAKVSGPGAVTFGNASLATTTASFSTSGTYVLRLTASDGSLSSADDVTVVVNPAPQNPATQTFTSVADAYAQDGATAGSNFGAGAELLVKKSSSAGFNREAYVKFDLTAYAGSASAVKLRLYGYLQDARTTNVATDVYDTTTAWAETLVNWNNKPAAGAKRGTLTVANTTGAYYEVDVTAFVQQELSAGRKTVAFLLRNAANTSPYSAFGSREAANKPQLVVTGTGGTPANQAPTVSAGTDKTVTLPASTNLIGTATDDGLPAGGALAVNWTKSSGPGAVTFGSATAATTTAVFGAAGTYVLRLTATDGTLTTSDEVTVVVSNPTVTPQTFNPTADTYAQGGSSATANFGTATTLLVKRATNADASRDAFLKFDVTSFSGTPSSVTLRIYGKLQDSREVNVATDVYATTTAWTETGLTWNNRPAAGTKVGTVIVQNATARYYDLDVTAFVQSELAAGRKVVAFLLRNPIASQPYTQFSSRNASTNRPQLVVTPASGTPANAAPSVDAGVDASVALPAALSIDGTVTDDGLPAGGAVTTSWSKVSGPGTVTFGSAATVDTTASFSVAGTYVLRLTASDGAISAADDVTVVVNAAQTGGQTPFGGSAVMLPGRIEAERFDDGGAGVAYADFDAGNTGTVYRTGVNVDVEAADDAGGGSDVGWTRAGEWLEYTVNVAATGSYNLDLRVASGNPGGTFHVEVDGANVTGSMNLFSTGGWSNWQTISKGGVPLTAGTHVVRLAFDTSFTAGDIGRVNWLQFTSASAGAAASAEPAAGEVWVQQAILAAGATGDGGGVASGPNSPEFQTALQPQAAGSQSLVSFTLINADTDQPISGYTSLSSGETINLAALPTRRLNIRANTSPTPVGSVRFAYDGNSNYRTESGAPYALASDAGGDYQPWTPAVGTHTLSATPYTGGGATGTPGTPLTILFNVIDAPPAGGAGAQQPYGGAFASVPGTIQAEDFDTGGEGVAYHDTDGVNQSGSYRAGGVDVESAADTGGGYNLGHVKAGEWLEYSVNVPVSGAYTVEVRVASGGPGGSFHLEFGAANKTGSMTLPNTGGWQTWKTVSKAGVNLAAGTQVMRLAVDSSAAGGDVGNINWIRLTGPTSTTPPTSTVVNWTAAAAAPLARDEAQGAVVNGKLFVVGGFYSSAFTTTSRVDVYDPASNSWSARKAAPDLLTHSATVVEGTTIWFIGGYTGNNPGPGTAKVWKYDTANDSWSAGPSLPSARGAGAAALLGRVIYFFGGRDANRTADQSSAWALNLDNQGAGWTAKAALPDARNHLAGIAIDGKVYAIGGQTGETTSAVNKTLVHAYDPATNAWTRVADLPAPRSHFSASAFVRDGRVVVVGGESAHNTPEANVWSYDPGGNKWTVLSNLPEKRRAVVAGYVNGSMIVTGGYTGFTHSTTTWNGVAGSSTGLLADASPAAAVLADVGPSVPEGLPSYDAGRLYYPTGGACSCCLADDLATRAADHDDADNVLTASSTKSFSGIFARVSPEGDDGGDSVANDLLL